MDKLKKIFHAVVNGEKLALHTAFNIGGPADFFCQVKEKKDLINIIRFAFKENLPYVVIGKGSNILFSDKGFRGIVIKMENKRYKIQNKKIIAETGISLNKLVLTAAEHYFDLSPFAGIPGTVGGAVTGNSGVKNTSISDIVEGGSVLEWKIKDMKCKIKEVNKNYFKFRYRHSILKGANNILLSVILKPKKRHISDIKKKIRENIKKRWKKYPQGFSGGSFFKNPSCDKPAWSLIDAAGCRGLKIGDVFVSEKHANFIMHNGNGTALDIVALTKKIRKKTEKKFGVKLVPEVLIIDENGREIKI